MSNTSSHPETRQRLSAEVPGGPEAAFKRLALPAVAAAVQTLARAKPRQTPQRDWTEWLRRNGQPI
jgi:hypothetical protein